jgi:hypothetical protein
MPVNSIQGFFIELFQPFAGSLDYTTDFFPPGTDVFANISLSMVDTLNRNLPDSTFVAVAYVRWWTSYLPDGTEGPQQGEIANFAQNAIGVQNVARINFELFVESALAVAQINIYGF